MHLVYAEEDSDCNPLKKTPESSLSHAILEDTIRHNIA